MRDLIDIWDAAECLQMGGRKRQTSIAVLDSFGLVIDDWILYYITLAPSFI